MPLIVDHHQRRLALANIVENMVYEGGVDCLTVRDVAKRAGFSTTVVSHYFRTKLEMLIFTHQAVRTRAESALAEAVEQQTNLETALIAILPISEDRKKDWTTWFAFWGMTAIDHRVTSEWQHGVSQAKDLFSELVRSGQRSANISASVDAESAGDDIQVIVNGISSLWAQDRSRWDEASQITLLKRMLSAVGLSQ